MDFMGKYGKKRCRNLFWRVKAGLKKALKSRSKQRLKLQYDPSSYALNFDEGRCCHSSLAANTVGVVRFRDRSDCKNIFWVYVVCVKY
ncbi:hypothetical protein HRI_000949000 [Hibiscus trionum]|uniref:Uncharacterized protein n=1 Tax=Hibiscus trionum TaxID=183268 RepID=A0A9W7LPV8_HIBTR|nr:hypothetical protein HRI_000949000 [Hibiscus trionum]